MTDSDTPKPESGPTPGSQPELSPESPPPSPCEPIKIQRFDEKPKDWDEVPDWVQKLEDPPGSLPEAPPIFAEIVKDLANWPVIFVSCEDYEVLLAVGYAVAREPDFAQHHRRKLEGSRRLSEADFAQLLSQPAVMAGRGADITKPTLLLIKANLELFFDKVMRDLPCISGNIEALRLNNSKVVCLLYPEALRGRKVPTISTDFHYLHIPVARRVQARPAAPPFEEPPFANIVRHGRKAERAALFVGAFLGPLDRRDFGRVMDALLCDEKEMREELAGISKSADGAEEKRFENRERDATKFWQEERMQVLERVGLRLSREHGRQLVSFQGESYEAAAREAFETDYDGPRPLFAKLYASSLYFDTETSDSLQTLLREAAFQRACEEPSEFGVQWLESTIDRFIEEERRYVEKAGDDIVLKVLLKLAGGDVAARFFSRMATLSGALLRDARTRPAVEGLFTRMLASGQHDPLRGLLLRLRGVEGFDYYSWLRRLLDEAESEVKARVLQHLVEQAAIAPERCAAILPEIAGWLPPKDCIERLSQTQLYCLAFPMPLINSLRERFERQRKKGILPRFPLPMADEDSSVAGLLGDWVSHPAFGQGLSAVAGTSLPSEPFIAELIEHIAQMVATLLEAASPGKVRIGLTRQLLTMLAPGRIHLREGLKPSQRLMIHKCWTEGAKALRSHLIELPPGDANADQRKELQRHLATINRLCRSGL
jgi:hypothetical protein